MQLSSRKTFPVVESNERQVHPFTLVGTTPCPLFGTTSLAPLFCDDVISLSSHWQLWHLSCCFSQLGNWEKCKITCQVDQNKRDGAEEGEVKHKEEKEETVRNKESSITYFTLFSFKRGRYKSRTGSTRTASPGRINSDRLGPTRIEWKNKNKIKLDSDQLGS